MPLAQEVRLLYALWHEGMLRLLKCAAPFYLHTYVCGQRTQPKRDVRANPSGFTVSVDAVGASAYPFAIIVLAFHGMADIWM